MASDNGRLNRYEFTEKGKALLPTPENKYGKFLEINGPDGYFKIKARLLEDYHCDQLMTRKDGRHLDFIKLKSPKTIPDKSTDTKTPKKQ